MSSRKQKLPEQKSSAPSWKKRLLFFGEAAGIAVAGTAALVFAVFLILALVVGRPGPVTFAFELALWAGKAGAALALAVGVIGGSALAVSDALGSEKAHPQGEKS